MLSELANRMQRWFAMPAAAESPGNSLKRQILSPTELESLERAGIRVFSKPCSDSAAR